MNCACAIKRDIWHYVGVCAYGLTVGVPFLPLNFKMEEAAMAVGGMALSNKKKGEFGRLCVFASRLCGAFSAISKFNSVL